MNFIDTTTLTQSVAFPLSHEEHKTWERGFYLSIQQGYRKQFQTWKQPAILDLEVALRLVSSSPESLIRRFQLFDDPYKMAELSPPCYTAFRVYAEMDRIFCGRSLPKLDEKQHLPLPEEISAYISKALPLWYSKPYLARYKDITSSLFIRKHNPDPESNVFWLGFLDGYTLLLSNPVPLNWRARVELDEIEVAALRERKRKRAREMQEQAEERRLYLAKCEREADARAERMWKEWSRPYGNLI